MQAATASAEQPSWHRHTCWLQIFQEAKELLPGGVNSPVRAFSSVGGQPIIFDHVKGANVWDVDGNK